MRPMVMLVYHLQDPTAEQELEKVAEVVRPRSDRPDDLAVALKDADAVILRAPARLTAELIDAAPRLAVIGAQGAGTDNIDRVAAERRGITIVSGAGVAPRAVAEYVVGAAVAAHRRFAPILCLLAAGDLDWERRLQHHRGAELTGSTFGVVGFGNIGRAVAQRVQTVFDAQVLAFDPYTDDVGDVAGVQRVPDLDELLTRSRTASVHVPLTHETRGLIGAERLDLIGPDGVLIHVARGGVVDEAALVAALHAGRLGGAVVDVFDPEPPTPDQLRTLAAAPNILLTPHVAGATDLALRALSRHVAGGVLRHFELQLEGGGP